MHMDGRAVFRWAVAILCDTIQDVLQAQRAARPSDVDLYIPHQANIRIINAAIDVLHIPRSTGLQQPRPLRQHLGRLGPAGPGRGDRARAGSSPDNLVVLSGFGAGLAWGTAVMRW